MKRFFLSVVLATTLALTSCQFDDSDIWGKLDEYGQSIKDHEQRISALEELCKQMNTNIEALQTLVDALEKRDYVTNVSEVRSNGEVIGYTISFAYSDTITIYHGKDGQDGANGADGEDGKDGYTPQIGVMKDTDGIYYWTLDGEWLLDAKGNKIKAVGTDGADGKDGQDGANGTDGKDGQDGTNGSDGTNGTDGKDGKDGVTPQLKIENDYWYVSYDNGATWVQLGKATGEDGQNGADGENGRDGDSIFNSVTQDDEYVYFNLADGTIITLPKYKEPVEKVNNKIYYTTTDGKKMFPASTSPNLFGAILISNTYEDGQGVLTFDDTVTAIGHGAFFDCTRLATITLEGGVEVIGASAFKSCVNLTSIVIPDSVTEINGGFENCTSLIGITIPDSVIQIGSGTFRGCTSLTSVTIPHSVIAIGGEAFKGCTNITEIFINSQNIDSIEDSTFAGCVNLTSFLIPDNVYFIGNSVFFGCSNLINVTIGSRVRSIGTHAFYGCSSLSEIYCKPTTPPTLNGNYVLDVDNYPSDFKIYVPYSNDESVIWTYKVDEFWSNYADYIEGYEF